MYVNKHKDCKYTRRVNNENMKIIFVWHLRDVRSICYLTSVHVQLKNFLELMTHCVDLGENSRLAAGWNDKDNMWTMSMLK